MSTKFSLTALGSLIQNVCLNSEPDGTEAHRLLTEMLNTTLSSRVRVPDLLHFVWIGKLSKGNYSYLPVWHRFNPDKKIYIWIDNSTDNCSLFQRALKNHVTYNPTYTLCELQNEAYSFIYPRIVCGEVFNTVAKEFLRLKKIGYPTERASQKKTPLLTNHCLYETRDIQTLFDSELDAFHRLYYYELILRGNLAAASDIIRLLVLYKFGGVYIDLDTLPDFDDIFRNANATEQKLKVTGNELVCLAKTAAFLTWFKSGCYQGEDVYFYVKHLNSVNDADKILLLNAIKSDILHIRENDIPALGCIFCYPDLMRIGTTKYLPGVYFNNFLCCAPQSRMVMITLKNIVRRYSFLTKRNYLFTQNKTSDFKDNPDGNINYRTDDEYYSDQLTLSLTGPGVIMDTLLMLTYRILPPDTEVSPQMLAQCLQQEHFCLTLKNQTLDTPMGLK